VESSAPKVSSYNKITYEFTYLVTMPTKPIGTSTRVIAPLLLTAVKWARKVSIQVHLQVTVCLGSETKYTSKKITETPSSRDWSVKVYCKNSNTTAQALTL
jgi:hypothetical protein